MNISREIRIFYTNRREFFFSAHVWKAHSPLHNVQPAQTKFYSNYSRKVGIRITKLVTNTIQSTAAYKKCTRMKK
jgi:hypothetical protein